MRYGGYILVALPFLIFTSLYLSKFSYNLKKIKKISYFLLGTSIIIFNLQNIKRINQEHKQYGYKPLESPYYLIPKLKFEKKNISNVLFYKPINNMCWNTPTPCVGSFNGYNIKRKFKKNIIERNE